MAAKNVLNREIVTTVKTYAADIKDAGVREPRLIVFGSHAKGRATVWSDIDVCVISPSFSGTFDDRLTLVRALTRKTINIEPHPFTPEEFADQVNPLASEIRAHGIPVDPA